MAQSDTRIRVALDVDVSEIRAVVKRLQRQCDELNRLLAQYQAGVLSQADRLREFGIDLRVGDDE